MARRSFLALLGLTAFSLVVQPCHGQGLFFWSASDIGESPLPQTFIDIDELDSNGSFELFLYYDPDGNNIDTLLSMDIRIDGNSPVAGFSSAEMLNFDVTISGVPVFERWSDFSGPTGVVDGTSVQGLIAVNSTGQGINTANVGPTFVDAGTDGLFFQVAKFEISTFQLGDFDISIENLQIVNQGMSVEAKTLNANVSVLNQCPLSCPPLDLFENRFVVPNDELPVNILGGLTHYNFDASNEPGEPFVENTFGTIWYEFTSPADGLLTVESRGAFDSQLHVFRDLELGLSDLTLVASNDDDVEGTAQSRVVFETNAGENFAIRIGSFFENPNFDPYNQGCSWLRILLDESGQGFLPGDLNNDGTVNLLDVAPFVAVIADGNFDASADVNQDGVVDLLDVAPFIALLQAP